MGLDDHFLGDFDGSGTPSHGSVELPADSIDDLWSGAGIHLDDLRTSATFVRELQQATLGDPTEGLACEGLERLRNPLHREPSASVNEDTQLAIDLYLGTPSEAMYETVCVAILCCWPGTDLLSYYRVKCLVADLSSVELIVHDMCVNSCMAFTGPFLELESCPMCSEP